MLWGVNYRRLGFPNKAIEHYQLAFQFYEAVQEPLNAAHALLNCGNVYMETGDYAEARRLYRQTLDIYEELGRNGTRGQRQGQTGIGGLA